MRVRWGMSQAIATTSTWSTQCGDCRTLLLGVPDASVDLVLADPPYGDTSLAWDRNVGGWASEVVRVLKPSGSVWVWCSLRYFSAIQVDFLGWKLAQDVVWEKHNGSNFHADRFRRVHEHAVQFYRGKWSNIFKAVQTTPDATKKTVRRKARPTHTGNIGAAVYESHDGGPRLMRSVFHERSCHGHAEHPTQKPTAVLRPLIEYSCPPGGVVLDPFMGSGSAGVASLETGRRFLGFEILEEYHAIARRRLGEVSTLFAKGAA